MHIGMEPAGSPLATINILGPTAVVSDFGNNAGLWSGRRSPTGATAPWRTCAARPRSPAWWSAAAEAFNLPGGPPQIPAPAGGVRRRARGRPLKKDMYICTAAAAGIEHRGRPGGRPVRFENYGEIRCAAVAAAPTTT